MSGHVLLNLLNNLGKRDKCEACKAFYHFLARSLIKARIMKNQSYRMIIVRFYLSSDTKSLHILKSHCFLCKQLNAQILACIHVMTLLWTSILIT